MTTSERRVGYRPFPELTKAFVAGRLRPTWKDLVWAATNHWLDAKALADLAGELAADDEGLRVALALALDNGEAVLAAVLDRQATGYETSEVTVRERWMRLAVAWLYEHREMFSDPWAVVEEIWEAFDHAESLNGLIRWMPVPPGEPSGEAAMMARWRTYAESQ